MNVAAVSAGAAAVVLRAAVLTVTFLRGVRVQAVGEPQSAGESTDAFEAVR